MAPLSYMILFRGISRVAHRFGWTHRFCCMGPTGMGPVLDLLSCANTIPITGNLRVSATCSHAQCGQYVTFQTVQWWVTYPPLHLLSWVPCHSPMLSWSRCLEHTWAHAISCPALSLPHCLASRVAHRSGMGWRGPTQTRTHKTCTRNTMVSTKTWVHCKPIWVCQCFFILACSILFFSFFLLFLVCMIFFFTIVLYYCNTTW